MEYNKFFFPDGAWNCFLKPESDGYIATWEDKDGYHMRDLLWYEVDDIEDLNSEIPEEDLKYYSDDLYTYRD